MKIDIDIAALEAALGLENCSETSFLIIRGEYGSGTYTVRLPAPGITTLDMKPLGESRDCVGHTRALFTAIRQAREARETEGRKQGLQKVFTCAAGKVVH